MLRLTRIKIRNKKANNQLNFNLEIQKLQTNLDMWKARGLTLFGKVLIIKCVGLSNLVYSISNLNVPKEIIAMVKDKLFRFLWKNKRDKIKRTSIYQDYCDGGLCMVDIELTIKSLRLAWIRRLLFCSVKKVAGKQFKITSLANREALIFWFDATTTSSI